MDRNTTVPTLRSLALRICVINANNFSSLGDLPFILVQPILQACSATQLASLEDQSPHLQQDTQDIWHRLVTERFKLQFEKFENENWRDVYERLKLEENERLESATARLRAKNGKLKEEKMAKQIVIIDPKKTPVYGDRKRPNPFGMQTSPQRKKNSLMEKARRETSLTKMNYAVAPRFTATRPTGPNRPLGLKIVQKPLAQPMRREPVPPNDKNVFGKLIENPQKPRNLGRGSFFDAIGK